MSTKTYTLTQDSEGHKIRKCSEYVITDEAGKVKAVSLLALDGETPIPLNKNFSAVTSPIVASSYATLIANASSVTDKTITISTESAKMLAEYCRYRGQQTRNLAFGGSYSGTIYDVALTYDNGVFTLKGTSTSSGGRGGAIYKNYFALEAGTYTFSIKNSGSADVVCFLQNDSLGEATYITSGSTTITLNGGNYFVSFNLNTITYNNTISVQIEQGTTATDFVPPLTTNTTIADANAKGFKVCTMVEGESYELLASLNFDKKHYVDTGVVLGDISDLVIDYTPVNISSEQLFGINNSGDNSFEFRINNNNSNYFHFKSSWTSINNVTFNTLNKVEVTTSEFYSNDVKKTNIAGRTETMNNSVLRIGNATNLGYSGSVNYVAIDNSLLVPANNGTTNGLLNLTTKTFLPLQ